MATPDYLRGLAVAHVVQTMNQVPTGGTWSLHECKTQDRKSVLTFKVGTIYPEDTTDTRQLVEIAIREVPE